MEDKPPANLPHDVAVIGAGLAGIACARSLQDAGFRVAIFEKSRSYGGRCSTRLWKECIVDHGTQYFTVTNPSFQTAIQNACAEDVVKIELPILDSAGKPLPLNKERYYHRKGNNRLARALAKDLDVRREHTLERLTKSRNGWELDFAERPAVYAAQVVLTCPWPQIAKLLGLHDTSQFEPCLTGLFLYSGINLENCGDCYARQGDKQSVLAWSALENHKRGRIPAGLTAFVVQSGPKFSKEYLEAPYDDWLSCQRAELQKAWGLPADCFLDWFGHRWRFARNLSPIPPVILPAGIHVAGDSLVPSRVEDAWGSGRACAEKILHSSATARSQC